jgi:3',5'-cyclic AMP phosphodiesterase CpdA
MLDAVIISDLHLGASNSRHREVKRFLWQMVRRTKRIVFNGDLVDHWNLPRWPREHRETLDSLRGLSERVEFAWITGNHEESSTKAKAILDLPFVDKYRFTSAGANRGKDPLYLFAALQRQLNYPEVPRPRPRDDVSAKLEAIQVRLRELDARLKLVEGELRGQVDLSQFGKPELLTDLPDDDK